MRHVASSVPGTRGPPPASQRSHLLLLPPLLLPHAEDILVGRQDEGVRLHARRPRAPDDRRACSGEVPRHGLASSRARSRDRYGLSASLTRKLATHARGDRVRQSGCSGRNPILVDFHRIRVSAAEGALSTLPVRRAGNFNRQAGAKRSVRSTKNEIAFFVIMHVATRSSAVLRAARTHAAAAMSCCGSRPMSIVSRATAQAALRRKQREAAVAAAAAAAPSSTPALAPPGHGGPSAVHATAATPAPVPAASDAIVTVRAALQSAAGVHAATISLIESSAEWADYDAHVTFELQALRHRYAAAANWGAMPTSLRSQMSAHLRQKQAAVMAGHAAELAGEVLAIMSRPEREALARQLLRLEWEGDAKSPTLLPSASSPGTTTGSVDGSQPANPADGSSGGSSDGLRGSGKVRRLGACANWRRGGGGGGGL